jgi:hypothetical protein
MNEGQIILYRTDDGQAALLLHARDGSVWMNQAQLAELFATSVPNISMHISNVLKDKELSEISVIQNYLTTAADGKDYSVTFYALEMILAIGYRVRSPRGTQFRQWATRHLAEFLVKGFLMDDERLKNPDGRPDYFDEILARIRDIRSSEKRFYQKVRDLFALSSDYDTTDKATQMFFAEAQNKLLYAATKKTAAELIVERADPALPNMALTSWKGKIVRRQDIIIAKNYLTEDELDDLNRLVTIFLETAELRAKNRAVLTMAYWRENVDRLIAFNEKPLLKGKGRITHEAMEEKVHALYSAFDARRKQADATEADQYDIKEIEALAAKLKKKGGGK